MRNSSNSVGPDWSSISFQSLAWYGIKRVHCAPKGVRSVSSSVAARSPASSASSARKTRRNPQAMWSHEGPLVPHKAMAGKPATARLSASMGASVMTMHGVLRSKGANTRPDFMRTGAKKAPAFFGPAVSLALPEIARACAATTSPFCAQIGNTTAASARRFLPFGSCITALAFQSSQKRTPAHCATSRLIPRCSK